MILVKTGLQVVQNQGQELVMRDLAQKLPLPLIQVHSPAIVAHVAIVTARPVGAFPGGKVPGRFLNINRNQPSKLRLRLKVADFQVNSRFGVWNEFSTICSLQAGGYFSLRWKGGTCRDAGRDLDVPHFPSSSSRTFRSGC